MPPRVCRGQRPPRGNRGRRVSGTLLTAPIPLALLVMRLTGFALLVVLSLGVAGYAMGVYGFLPLGAGVHPDMRATFEAHRTGIYVHVFASGLHGAGTMGFRGDAVLAAEMRESIDVPLVRDLERRTLLLEAVPRRQSTRAEFDAEPLSNDEPRLLESAGSGNGVRAHLLTDRQAMESMLDSRGGRAFPRFSQ